MIAIGVAATAGIVVGAVTLTGIGLVMTDFVEFISAGNVILMLFTAVLADPRAGFANYRQLHRGFGFDGTGYCDGFSGLIVPLIAVHVCVLLRYWQMIRHQWVWLPLPLRRLLV